MENDPVFELHHGSLLIPDDLRGSIPAKLILSLDETTLWMFSHAQWHGMLDKLKRAKPCLEKDALLRLIAIALEIKATPVCIPLPKPFQPKLGPNSIVLLDGKPIGVIA